MTPAGGEVVSIGKIADIYANRGITRKVKASGNAALFDATLEVLAEELPGRPALEGLTELGSVESAALGEGDEVAGVVEIAPAP